jgi:hypothetical protein
MHNTGWPDGMYSYRFGNVGVMVGGFLSVKSRDHFRIGIEALNKVPLALIVSLILGIVVGPSLAQEPPVPSARATRVEEAPILDGVLDEALWQLASPVGEFRQRNPQEGIPATEPTEVRIVYSSDAIFFGIICYDSQPNRIIATQRARAADLNFDDSFSIILDTFHSHRNSFLFQMNPLGARFDSEGSGT